MICPFCHSRLQVWVFPFHTTYGCDASMCVNDDMPRYQITYNNYPTSLLSRVFMIDDYYIKIDYVNQKTIISILEACFLMATIELPRIFHFNKENPADILAKIKTLLIFS